MKGGEKNIYISCKTNLGQQRCCRKKVRLHHERKKLWQKI